MIGVRLAGFNEGNMISLQIFRVEHFLKDQVSSHVEQFECFAPTPIFDLPRNLVAKWASGNLQP